MITVHDVAGICHEANRAYCLSLNDYSQPAWTGAPAWQVESAENGVRFHLENPEATPGASHENWMRQKLEEGWSYGPVKDAVTKQHPCLVPFEELSLEQQVKDIWFSAIVQVLAPLIEGA